MARTGTMVLDRIGEVNCLTERVKGLKKECREEKARLTAFRSRCVTESWQETEGEPLVIRRARYLQKLAENHPVFIREGELIVGSLGPHVLSTVAFPDWDADAFLRMFADKAKEGFTSKEDYQKIDLDRQVREMILEDAAYWKERCPSEHVRKAFRAQWGEKAEDWERARLCSSEGGDPGSGGSVDFKKMLNRGLNGLISEVEENLHKTTSYGIGNKHKVDVWRAMIMACQAMINFSRRHAELARQLVKRESDEVRKRELERIAEICDWVPANPARNFHEALQSLWFIKFSLILETGKMGSSMGRVDQYMYPFYHKDLQEGRISQQEAAELLGCFWVKMNQEVQFRSSTTSELKEGPTRAGNIVIGGVDADGRDATNELSYLILEVDRQMKLPIPRTTLRYHDALPEELLIKAIEVAREVAGKPMLLNDKMMILNLCMAGVPLTEARNWHTVGCGRAYPQEHVSHYSCSVNLAKVLELTLNNGIDPRTGKQLGITTGDARDFTSFEALYEALKKQYSIVIETARNRTNFTRQVVAETYHTPFESALTDRCIKKGLDGNECDVRYPQLSGHIDVQGHVNVADSLTAIKKLVYENKAISIAELLEALAANFEGKEKLRAQLLEAPKYGNDDDYADEMLVDIYKWTRDIIAQQPNIWGYPYRIGRRGLTRHRYFGKAVGALPDGRKAFEILSDGSLSPMRGADIKGPTAVLNSAAKVDPFGSEVTILNQKFFPSAVANRDGIRKLLAMVKTYFDRYGYHIQFNFFDPQTLLEAKKHPEEYRNLIVRVSGYSAYFVDLSPEIQDEIIARSTQGL